MPLLTQFKLKKGSKKDYRFGQGRSFISKKKLGPKIKTGTIAGNLNKRLKKTRKPNKNKPSMEEAVIMIQEGKPIENVVEYLLN